MKKIIFSIGFCIISLASSAQFTDSLRAQFDTLKAQMLRDKIKYQKTVVPVNKAEDKAGIVTAYLNSKSIPMFIFLDKEENGNTQHFEYYFYDSKLFYVEQIKVLKKEEGSRDRFYLSSGKLLAWYDSFNRPKSKQSEDFNILNRDLIKESEKLKDRVKK